MTQPLDFTSAGRKKSSPPPQDTAPRQKAPRRRLSAIGSRKAGAALLVAVVVVGFAAFVFVRRGGKNTVARPSATYIADQRFCELWDMFNQFTGAAGVSMTTPVAGAIHPDQLRQGFAQFAPSVPEFERVAPVAISGDLKLVVSSVQQAAAGDLGGIHSPAFTTAGRRVVQTDTTLITEKNGPCQKINGSELAR